MIGIKKVSVTPVTPNTGDIIDSFNTSDNKHTNAPSINAVETVCKVKGDFAYVDAGTLTMAEGKAHTTVNYPSGFTKTNCVVISFMADNVLNSGLSYGYIEDSAGFIAGAIGHRVTLLDNNIAVYINNPIEGNHDVGTASFKCSFVLMKVS